MDHQDHQLREPIVAAGQPDWWGRLMGLGSLLMAATALFYASQGPGGAAADPNAITVELQQQNATQQQQIDGVLARMDKLTGGAVHETRRPFDEVSAGDAAVAEQRERADDGPQNSRPLDDSVRRYASSILEPIAQPEATADTKSDAATNLVDQDAESADDSQVAAAMDQSAGQSAGQSASQSADTDQPLKLSALDDIVPLENQGTDSTETDAANDPARTKVDVQLAPLLAVVRSAFRPYDGLTAPTVTIRNTGSQPAQITRISFDPQEVEENVSTASVRLGFPKSSSSTLAILFEDADNQSASQGTSRKHGRYVKRIDPPYAVPPNAEVEVILGINHADFLGYGLSGDLDVEYNVTERLERSEIPIAFFDVE